MFSVLTSIKKIKRPVVEVGYHCKKIKFSIKDFFSKYDQTRSFLRIWSYLLEKSFMENFIFYAVVDLRVISKCNKVLFQILLGVSSCISYLKWNKLLFRPTSVISRDSTGETFFAYLAKFWHVKKTNFHLLGQRVNSWFLKGILH